MKKYIMPLLCCIPLYFSGCTSSTSSLSNNSLDVANENMTLDQYESIKRLKQGSDKETAVNFSVSVIKGQFTLANQLMCFPKEDNDLYKYAEQLYAITKQKPYAGVIRHRLLSDHLNFDDTNNNIENQIFTIKQAYYFNYSKHLIALVDEEGNNVDGEIKAYLVNKKNVNEKVTELLFKTMSGKREQNYFLKTKALNKNEWCVEEFKLIK